MTMENRIVNVPGGDPVQDAGIDLDDLTLDATDFDDTSFDNCDVVVRDVYTQAGGGEGKRQDGTTFTTQDQIILLLDVIDVAFPEGGSSRIYLGLPKVGPDGKRARPRKNSKYAIFMEMLSSLGVSATPGMDFVYHLSRPTDLIGLKFHRQSEQMEVGGFSMKVDKPTELHGFDHILRAEMSGRHKPPLEPVEYIPTQTV